MGKRNIKSIQSFFSNSGILKPFSTLIADGADDSFRELEQNSFSLK